MIVVCDIVKLNFKLLNKTKKKAPLKPTIRETKLLWCYLETNERTVNNETAIRTRLSVSLLEALDLNKTVLNAIGSKRHPNSNISGGKKCH